MKKFKGMRICSVCGKEFLPAPKHMYKVKGKFQDTYSCYKKEGGDHGRYIKQRFPNPEKDK